MHRMASLGGPHLNAFAVSEEIQVRFSYGEVQTPMDMNFM